MASLEKIVEPLVLECANCDEEFDHNHAERMRAKQLHHQSEQTHLWTCAFLTKEFYRESSILSLYETPWDDEPFQVAFCTERCEQEYCYPGFGSFEYVHCEECERQVCEQNPANGWHTQFRDHASLGYICLACYEDEILTCGQPREDYESDTIRGGMFFNHKYPEPKEAGYTAVEGFKDYFVRTHERVRAYNQRALELMDSGHRVLTALERMAIGGLEGYVTMFAKMGDDA